MKKPTLLSNPNIRSALLLLLFFIGIGIVSLVAGVRNYMQEEAFFATAEQDTATITEYVPDPNYKTADFCPKYDFTTKAGQAISYIGSNCLSKPDSSQIGQQEQVYIDPAQPQIIESRGWTGSEGTGLIMGIAGFVFFPFIGLVSFLATFFSERKKAATTTWNSASASSTDAELAQLEREEERLKREIKKRRG
jgi:hypothetical protein